MDCFDVTFALICGDIYSFCPLCGFVLEFKIYVNKTLALMGKRQLVFRVLTRDWLPQTFSSLLIVSSLLQGQDVL